MICVLCGQDITPGQAFSRCAEPVYAPQELEAMGLGDIPPNAYTCDAASHLNCMEAFSAPRSCCAPVRHPENLCYKHAGLGPGFLCLDCGLWHQPHCFARPGTRASMSVPMGLCTGCNHAMRLHLAMQDITDVPLETLEALAEALRALDVADSGQLAEILGIVRDLGEVRVPHARKETVDTAVAVRALQRVLGTARRLQSGQEREFFELLSRSGIEDEFRAQQSIPLDVAARNGMGRRSIVVTPDFAHRALPYVIFLDSRLGHSSEAKLVEDAEITAELNHIGYFVRRLRNAQLRPEFQAQTLETVQRDLEHLRSEVVRKGFV